MSIAADTGTEPWYGTRQTVDTPGSNQNVMNRGVARRPLFENRSGSRYFFSPRARQVRAGRLEIIAYSLMTTHFHLSVRSPLGDVSDAMRLITNKYARW